MSVMKILNSQADMEYSITHGGKSRPQSRCRTPKGELDFDALVKKRQPSTPPVKAEPKPKPIVEEI